MRSAGTSGPGSRGWEDGSGTVALVGVVAACLVLALCACVLGAAHSLRVRLQAVADISALAGAEVSALSLWIGQEDACPQAQRVARANGFGLDSCAVRGLDTLVTLGSAMDMGAFAVRIQVRSRAGPQGRT